jgi:hypothetical protein
MGKSELATLEDSTQLCTFGSWVSSRTGFIVDLL